MTTRIIVELDIEGDRVDAAEVVDRLLDAGFFQDSINEHDVDGAGPLHVKSAIIRFTEAV